MKARKGRQDSFGGDPTADPWASPVNAKLPPPSTTAASIGPSNGLSEEAGKAATNGISRTTSTFTTRGDQPESASGSPTESRIAGTGAGGWGSYNGGSGGFSEQSTLGGGFGDSGDDRQPNNSPGHDPRSLGASVAIPPGTGESVTVTLLPEKEGMFLFQHHNYEVKTVRRGISVVRRYSDFVWLLDCLQKRYPFRRLPLLPPKRVQGKIPSSSSQAARPRADGSPVNGNHLAGDAAVFLEKRRRGLVRFSNALVQHPILSQETLVVMFLTVPTVRRHLESP